MVKSESDMIFKPRTGQVITAENGTQYFVCGNNRIKSLRTLRRRWTAAWRSDR